MAEHCQFDDIHDELIRGRLVGLRDPRLAERLQLDLELTLEKAANQATQSVKNDQSSYEAKKTVYAAYKSKFYRRKEQQKRKNQGHTAIPHATRQSCGKSPSRARGHPLPKVLYVENVGSKGTLVKHARVKLLQQLNNRARAVTLQKYL